jgi:ribose transport system ATP-binding protein
VQAGEIVGIGGLVGQGQEEFLLGLYGAVPATARSAIIGAEAGLPASPVEASRRGIVYVPADRKNEALLLIHSIGFNLLLPSFGQLAKNWLRNRRGEAEMAHSLASRLTIRGDLKRPVQALSGGNQQKVALAKWLPRAPSIFLLNDPTRGVDVETKREIYVMLRNLAAEGKAIVLLSSDAPELVHLCDRVAVFREGRIAATLGREELSEEAIVAASMGIPAGRAAA